EVRPALITRARKAGGFSCSDDRVQNALIKAWQLRSMFNARDDNRDLYCWIARILDYEIQMYLREQQRHSETLLPPTAVFALLDGPYRYPIHAEQWLAQRTELHKRLRNIVLPPRAGDCIGAGLGGEPLAAIGARLETPISASAVCAIIHKIKILLRSLDSDDDSRDILECIENLPASLFYIAPSASWKHTAYRPDRSARTRSRKAETE